MKRFLSYNYNFEKFVAAMTHMAMKVADLTKLRAAKLLYFADKYHLTNYGRPIIGDFYVRMDHGPVPSQSLDLMNELVSPYVIRGAKRPTLNAMQQYLEVDSNGKQPKFVAKKKADYSALSESDVEALDKSIALFGKASITRVWNAGHNERSWKETPPHQKIDYRLFFDESSAEQRALLALLEEDQAGEELLNEGLASGH
jgi:uncharacterized phage-associated protein